MIAPQVFEPGSCSCLVDESNDNLDADDEEAFLRLRSVLLLKVTAAVDASAMVS
jgi:hypothetical protein